MSRHTCRLLFQWDPRDLYSRRYRAVQRPDSLGSMNWYWILTSGSFRGHAAEPRAETPARAPGLLLQLGGGEIQVARVPALIDQRGAVPHLAFERARAVAVGIPDVAGRRVERADPDP